MTTREENRRAMAARAHPDQDCNGCTACDIVAEFAWAATIEDDWNREVNLAAAVQVMNADERAAARRAAEAMCAALDGAPQEVEG